MDKEVFSKKEFTDYAKKNLALVKVDFPKKKAISPSLKQANEQLMRTFKVSGFPTMLVLDSEGKELGRDDDGYQGGGPKAVIAFLEKLKGK